MGWLIFIISLALVTFYIWLGVRALNRRETWGLRTAIVFSGILLALLVTGGVVMLALNYGPMKWFHSE